MPNGKPGDHPLSDLLSYGHPAFGPPVDDLLVSIAEAGHRDRLSTGPIAERLWDLWPKWGRESGDEPEYAQLEAMLREVLAEIEDDAPRS